MTQAEVDTKITTNLLDHNTTPHHEVYRSSPPSKITQSSPDRSQPDISKDDNEEIDQTKLNKSIDDIINNVNDEILKDNVNVTVDEPEQEEDVNLDQIYNFANSTMGKESPLTDLEIGTSPPLDILNDTNTTNFQQTISNDENSPSLGTHQATESRKNSLDLKKFINGSNGVKKDNYESSELSDVSDSDADTMLYGVNSESDLQNLAKLTEFARLKEIDSSDAEMDDSREKMKNENVQNESDANLNRSRDIAMTNESNEVKVPSKKRNLPDEDDDSQDDYKKLKVEKSISTANVLNIEDKLNQNEKPENVIEEIQNNQPSEPLDDEENEAEAEDEEEGEDDEEAEEDDEDDDEEEEQKKQSLVSEEEAEDITSAILKKEEDVAEEEDVDLNEQRKLAIEELISIETKFANLRDKLYQDKLFLLEKELELCLEGSHPELTKICLRINEFHQDNLKLAESNLSYKLNSINKETIATRTSIHQDFIKNIMDTKNEMITETTSLWYKINKERNQMDQLIPDFNFTAIPTTTISSTESNDIYSEFNLDTISKKQTKQNTLMELVHNRNSLNEQIGVLNGLVNFHGFPSAISSSWTEANPSQGPDELLLKKATDQEIKDDLKAMGIAT